MKNLIALQNSNIDQYKTIGYSHFDDFLSMYNQRVRRIVFQVGEKLDKISFVS